MKYIRTKSNDIWELKSDGFYHKNNCVNFISATDESVVKQADTIEELCDLFVIFTKDNNYVFWNSSKAPINNVKDFYGAIWTNKGLIYVAKINDKGELELL